MYVLGRFLATVFILFLALFYFPYGLLISFAYASGRPRGAELGLYLFIWADRPVIYCILYACCCCCLIEGQELPHCCMHGKHVLVAAVAAVATAVAATAAAAISAAALLLSPLRNWWPLARHALICAASQNVQCINYICQQHKFFAKYPWYLVTAGCIVCFQDRFWALNSNFIQHIYSITFYRVFYIF